MIACTSCQHKEFFGALYCSECGTQLTYLELSPTETAVHNGKEDAIGSLPGVEELLTKTPMQTSAESRVSIKLMNSGLILPLDSGAEFTLGRVSGNQPILPDVDLTPYQAYEGGVSRLHATIRIEKSTVTLTDLGSANGTRVNGQLIHPHTIQPLENGDMIALGRFKIQILIRS